MTFDEFTKLLAGHKLFRLDAVLSPKLVPPLYALGLASILLWAITHLVIGFGAGFWTGLWGLVEIVAFGLLMVVALRIACEALLVFFKAHETASDHLERTRVASTSLLEEVRDAIRDLGEAPEAPADPYLDYTDGDDFFTSDPDPDEDPVENSLPRPKIIRRTAKRMPRERF